MTDNGVWWNCYNSQWGDELVPEAFSHPAKGAPGLSKRIYDHAIDEGWLSAGDTVLDPFGGVAGFGLQAMAHGLSWIGVELEQKFVDLGNQNIALWNRRYSLYPKWGSAALLQGDSRNLLAVVEAGRASGVISSPPFGADHTEQGGSMPKYLQEIFDTNGTKNQGYQNQGQTPGNLGNLRATEAGFAASVSSPPYSVEALGHAGAPTEIDAQKKLYGRMAGAKYGSEPGQLGSMRSGDFSGVVSSQPYEHRSYEGMSDSFAEWREMQGRDNAKPGAMAVVEGYGHSTGQLAGSGSDDFWSAARIIVAQTFAALRPGGHAIFVVKSFVRNKQLVDFPGQWRQLCESCGFVMLHEHRAMLVAEHEQLALDGGNGKRKERKSFFRRLAEKNGSPRIDFETVLCMGK